MWPYLILDISFIVIVKFEKYFSLQEYFPKKRTLNINEMKNQLVSR